MFVSFSKTDVVCFDDDALHRGPDDALHTGPGIPFILLCTSDSVETRTTFVHNFYEA